MKTRSIIAILILLAIILLSIQSLVQYNARIKIQHSLERLTLKMDKASHDLMSARTRMEVLRSELNKLQNYIDSTSLKVKKLNQNRQSSSFQYEQERLLIIAKLEKLYLSIDSTSKALPEIQMQE